MRFFLIFIALFLGTTGFASHIVGGKITYKFLGAGKYEIRLIVYRDCGVIADFDNPAFISIFNKANNSLVYNNGLLLQKRDTIKGTSTNPCFVPPPGICVETGTYIDTVFLPSNASGYTIAYQRCCRNASVLNISLPSMNGMTITTDIPPQSNSTPNFLSQPPIFLCLTDTFNYSFAATDPNGDSLVYQLCTPLSGANNSTTQPNPTSPPPFAPINWVPPYTATNPIPNSGGITLNPNTGQLKFKPSMIGQFGIGICVAEYRNGNLINTNRLDFQFNIVNCYLVASIPTASNLCVGLNVNFLNGSTNATSFTWNFGDLTTLADTSHFVNPSYSYPSYGTYTVSLTAVNNTYGNCTATATKVINIHPLLSPTLQPSYSLCYKNNQLNLNIGGAYHPSATFNWNFGANANPPTQNTNPGIVHFTNPNTQNVVAVVSQFGCTHTLVATVTFSNPVAKTDKDKLDCYGINLNFPNLSTGANQYYWDFGDPSTNADTSSLFSPTYLYPNFNTYTMTLIAKDGICSDTLKLPIVVNTTLSLNPVSSFTPQCFKNNSFNFFANGIYGSGANFNWSFQNGNPFSSNVENPQAIHFTNSGIDTVVLSISQYGCTKTRSQIVQIWPDPKAKVTVSDTIGCQPLKVRFHSLDSIPSHNNWNIDDVLFKDTTVNYVFNNSGLFSFSILVTDTNNCSDSIGKQNYINVLPKPQANSLVSPLSTNILNPEVIFIDSTSGLHSTYFDFGDGLTSTQVSNTHTYNDEGQYPYLLLVTNNYGCTDTLNDIIRIEGIPYGFVPNIFTPNNDGVNDVFKIRGEYIKSSSMIIFNRWGGVVCEINDALEGWKGINRQSNLPADDGTYFYVIQLTLKNEKSYKFKGNVSLFR